MKMGVEAELYMSKEWEVEEIITFLKAEFGHVTWEATKFPEFIYVHLHDMDRRIAWFTNSDTPIGKLHCLRLSVKDYSEEQDFKKQTLRIFYAIAGKFGGFVVENDCEDRPWWVEGEFPRGDGMHYFLRQFVIRGGNYDDAEEFRKFVTHWKQGNYDWKPYKDDEDD
jgi:hypothetical protein